MYMYMYYPHVIKYQPVTYREERDKEHAAQLTRKIKEVIDDNLTVICVLINPLTKFELLPLHIVRVLMLCYVLFRRKRYTKP